jgi:hypothetical protein
MLMISRRTHSSRPKGPGGHLDCCCCTLSVKRHQCVVPIPTYHNSYLHFVSATRTDGSDRFIVIRLVYPIVQYIRSWTRPTLTGLFADDLALAVRSLVAELVTSALARFISSSASWDVASLDGCRGCGWRCEHWQGARKHRSKEQKPHSGGGNGRSVGRSFRWLQRTRTVGG